MSDRPSNMPGSRDAIASKKGDEIAGFMAACDRRQKEILQSLCQLPGVDVQKLGEMALGKTIQNGYLDIIKII